MANERMERVVQCCISLILMLVFFPFGCATATRGNNGPAELAECVDCIQRVSRIYSTEYAENSGVENEKSEDNNGGKPQDLDDENDPQTHELEEAIDLDHPEDNYHEVYASAEGVGGGPISGMENSSESGADSRSGYDGILRWHEIEFQEAITKGIRDTAFRNREVSAAHCHFSKAPNKDTPVFAMLVRHASRADDTFYLGREGMAISKINTAALRESGRGMIRLVKSQMYCVYREDQNEAGALIFQFQAGRHGDGEPQYALVRVEATSQRQPTDRTMLVEEAQPGTRMGGAASEVQVQVYEYVAAESRVVGVFSTFEQALAEGEKVIPRGRFRLRIENTYPYMKWQSYLGADEPEFCPAGVECQE